MQRYCLGFVVSLDKSQVMLIEKRRPHWQAGRFNGIGGKLEEGETALDAMARECREETGLEIAASNWQVLGDLGDDQTWQVTIFWSIQDLTQATSLTDEPLRIVDLDTADTLPLIDNVGDMLESLRQLLV